MKTFVLIGVLVLAASAAPIGQAQPQAPPQPAPAFRSSVNLILVDVVVRDKNGAVVKGLKIDDFELLEDGVRQQVLTFASEEITTNAAPVSTTSTLSATATSVAAPRRGDPPATVSAPAGTTTAGNDIPVPLTSEDVAGHRLLTLVFDTSSMQPEDVQKAADAALKWVDEQMTPADLVAVASIGSSLQILSDFTSSKEQVHAALASFSAAEGTAESALSEVRELLKCGTNCGSCLPELKRLATETRVANEMCR